MKLWRDAPGSEADALASMGAVLHNGDDRGLPPRVRRLAVHPEPAEGAHAGSAGARGLERLARRSPRRGGAAACPREGEGAGPIRS
jgi:hypothetical protein